MSEINDNDKSNPGARKPLTLSRTASAGTVRQSFSHGRTKSVEVEVKRKRVVTGPPGTGAHPAPTAPRPAAPAPPPTANAAPRPAAAPQQAPRRPDAPSGNRAGAGLSDQEMRARQAALERARQDEAVRAERDRIEREARAKREAEERAALDARRQEEAAADAQARAAAEAERRAAIAAIEEPDAIAQDQRAQTARPVDARQPEARGAKPAPAPPAANGAAKPAEDKQGVRAPTPVNDEDTLADLGGRVKKKVAAAPLGAKPISRTKGEQQRRSGKLTIVTALSDDEDEKVRSLAAMKRAREKEKERRMRSFGDNDQPKIVREVVIPESITVQELANRMATRAVDLIKYLMKQGQLLKINDVLDQDTAELIVGDFGHSVKRVAESDVEEGFIGADDVSEEMSPRPPIVTIMGHVDHGKTSLLDALRQTDVVSGEAGGITQHIGAYQVRLADGQRVTFIDTPGHAAFSSMRARGAQVTDIVILVVAADDGVMPQTIEAISHAKAAKVPIIVAINKIDKPAAQPQRVVNELLQYEIITEANGGDVLTVEVSALKKLNLDKLLETILLQAEIMDLRANADRAGEGVVVESQLDKGRGPVATVLVRRGTLKRGDIVVAGAEWGKVRALVNERNEQLQEVGPSAPVEILGLEGVPDPGDQFAVVESEARAREITEYRQRKKRESSAATGPRSSLEQMMARLKRDEAKELPVVIKADVQGSAEAITGAIEKIGTEEVRAKAIFSAPGAITESDVLLARASGAAILGFNVRANKQARDLAEREGVEIRYYSIIYNLIDDLKGVLSGMLAPERKETFIGYAEILEVFDITKIGKVAGCRITEGTVRRGCGVRLLRDNVVIHEGNLGTLKRFKEEVQEVFAGQECGMGFVNYQDIRKSDFIECFTVEVIKRTL